MMNSQPNVRKISENYNDAALLFNTAFAEVYIEFLLAYQHKPIVSGSLGVRVIDTKGDWL